MISRNTLPVWIGVILLAGMFLTGQEAWPPPCDEVVNFPDPNLEQAIRGEIGKPEGPICASDLEGLTSLSLAQRGISDLTGLEYCSGLTELVLTNNQISDLSPLAGLTGLETLQLHNTQISDLSPLAGLTGLEYLWLSYSQISDLSPLAGLTGLTWLHLSSNQISDLSPLAGLTGLAELVLAFNQISDIYPLVQNSGIGDGDDVYLTNNPLDETSCTTYIPQLESRGVTVTHFCP